MAKLYGWWKANEVFRSNSTEMRVYFHTDDSATRDGFMATFMEGKNLFLIKLLTYI